MDKFRESADTQGVDRKDLRGRGPRHAPIPSPRISQEGGARIRVMRLQSRICIGGPALNTILLSAHLDTRRFETRLLGGALDPGEASMDALAREKGVSITVIPSMGRSISWVEDLRALLALIRYMRDFRPHIVHTHTAKAGALGRVAAWLCRVPVRIHTFHGHVFHGYFSRFWSRMVIWVERMLARMSTAIVAISPRQRKDLVEAYRVVPDRKCHVIRLGFELDKLKDGQPGRFKAQLGLPSDVMLVGIIARLVPIKNHHLFVKAVAHWVHRQKGFSPNSLRFLIIGDGELREDLQTLVTQLELEEWVIFTGWVENVADIYADLNLNVLVSRNEGTPVTLIEGLSVGVPALCTEVGGVRDFLDAQCGTIVDPFVSSEELAAALDSLLNSEIVTNGIHQDAQARILEMFDVSRLLQDMQSLYEAQLRQCKR